MIDLLVDDDRSGFGLAAALDLERIPCRRVTRGEPAADRLLIIGTDGGRSLVPRSPVLLFGAAQLAAFPVDTWVLKSLARRYGLTGWKPVPVAHFGRTHFGPLAGLAQQYLFAWERRHGGR